MNETNQVDLLESLKTTDASELLIRLKDLAWEQGPKLVGAIAILIIGIWVAKMVRAVLRRVLNNRKMDPIITSFIVNMAYIALVAFVVIAAMQQLGIATTSFVAVLGAAGLAIGLALQGSLSNFAAGFMLIIFRPFKQGDYVEAGGTAGLVEEIQVFTTVLKTPDNKKVIIPNSSIMGGNIINFSAHPNRRVDWVFGVSYTDDIDKVKATIRRIVEADERVQKEPAVFIVLSSLGDSSVNFTVRAWAKATDYWALFFDINERMKKAFDAEDISIPFPQRDVHLYQETK